MCDDKSGELYSDLFELSADEKKRLEYEAREKALLDYISQMKSATRRGLREGRKEGIKEGRALAKQVFQMHIAGKSISEITMICNISEDEVSDILF